MKQSDARMHIICIKDNLELATERVEFVINIMVFI